MNGFDEKAVYSKNIIVDRSMLDENQHVNNVVYVQWMQDIAILHSEKTGGTEMMHELDAVWVTRSHKISYYNQAFLNEEVTAITWISNIKRVTSLRKYCFLRKSDNTILARGETDWVLIDRKSGRPKKIPPEMIELYPVLPEENEPCRKI